MEGGGYRNNDGLFIRQIIIDKTLFEGFEYEPHRITGYRYFQMPEFDVGLSFDELTDQSLANIRRRIEAISERLRSHADNIFASEDGLFVEHIGEAPIMHAEKPEKIATPGRGEAGRIIGAFLGNEARLQRGLSTADVPWYAQRLWDDDKDNDGESDTILAAPSLRLITGLIASLFGPIGSLIHGLVGSVADVIHSGDVLTGLLSIGKQLLLAGIGAGIGEIFSVATDAIQGLGGIESAVAEGAISLTRNVTTSVTEGLVSSIQLDTAGQLHFNDDAFVDRIIGVQSIGSLVGGLGSSVTGSLLRGPTIGFSAGDSASLSSFSSFVGGAVGSGIESAITGDLTLNLLNSADIDALFGNTNPRHSTGLLQLQIGDDGANLAFGSGGFGIGVQRLSGALQGIEVWEENLRIMDFADRRVDFTDDYTGGRDASAALRVQYSSREFDAVIYDQYQRLLDGTDHLLVGIDGATAHTRTLNGNRIVQLAQLGDDNDAASLLRAGIVLGHEAYRNGIVDDEQAQRIETLEATIGHTALAERIVYDYGIDVLDDNLRDDIDAWQAAHNGGGLEQFAAYVGQTYDASDDFWRLTEHGSIEWDGSRDVTDWNDNLLISDETGSMSQSLIRYVGLERAAEILDRKLTNWDDYDQQTLDTVTGLDSKSRDALKSQGVALTDVLSIDQLQQLAGEELMRSAGLYGANHWINNEVASFALSAKQLRGQIYLSDQLVNNEYERFVVDVSVLRNSNSYRSRRGDLSTQGRDTLVAEKRGLDGELIDRHILGGLQTVDLYDSIDGSGVDRNQPYFHREYGWVQGNTIAPGELWLQVGAESHYAGGALLINQARTISGHYINEQGLNEIIGGGRWLLHANRLDNMSRDFNNKSSDGCLIPSTMAHLEFIDTLESWGLKPGYNIVGELVELRK